MDIFEFTVFLLQTVFVFFLKKISSSSPYLYLINYNAATILVSF